MTIRYECTECGAGLKIKVDLAGTQGKCPKCKTPFVVPSPDGSAIDSNSGSVDGRTQNDTLDLPPVDEPDELTEDPTADLFDDFEPTPVFIPDQPDPAAESKSEKRRKRRERKEKLTKRRVVSSATTAGSAQALLNASAEKKRMQSGMPDPVVEQDNETADAIRYYGTRLVLPGFGFLLCCYLFYAWASSETLELPPLGQVSGTVKLDGQPLSEAKITFEPIFELRSERFGSNAIGYSDENGYYELVYSLPHNVYGAVIGKNRVTIESNGSVFVPPRYNMQSELVRNVEYSNDPMDFELTGE